MGGDYDLNRDFKAPILSALDAMLGPFAEPSKAPPSTRPAPASRGGSSMGALETAALIDQAVEHLDEAGDLLGFTTEDVAAYGALYALRLHLDKAEGDLIGADLADSDYAETWAEGEGSASARFGDAAESLAAAGGEGATGIQAVQTLVTQAQESVATVRATVAEYDEARKALIAQVKACQDEADKLLALMRKAFDEQMVAASDEGYEAQQQAEEIAEKLRNAVA